MSTYSNVETFLTILKDEAKGDVASALLKMATDYKMTWMHQGREVLFPATSEDVHSELDEAYPIKGREYDIRNIAEGDNVVMIEMIESYPDPDTGEIYRTPQVIVLEFKDGLIRTGRHYNDPRLSFLNLTKEQIDAALRDTSSKMIISDV